MVAERQRSQAEEEQDEEIKIGTPRWRSSRRATLESEMAAKDAFRTKVSTRRPVLFSTFDQDHDIKTPTK